MKTLIQHLLRANREEILKRSLVNCHAHGVHSIMLLECPGKSIRLFVAEPGSDLSANFPGRIQSEQSVAFHAHHCELTLLVTRGMILNLIGRISSHGGWIVGEYRHRSAITKGAIGFERLGTANVVWDEQVLRVGQSVAMPAQQIHTVACDDWAAWLVFEGREDPCHDNRCWSFSPLERLSFDNLYQPMTEPILDRLLHDADLL